MQTIGQYIRSTRESHNISIADLEELTKIKKEFLRSIEMQNWDKLPEYTVVLGFVKNITKALELDDNKALALFRRDYPASKIKSQNLTPKKDLPREFRFSPRITFGLGVIIIILVILGYLVLQYRSFINPPSLVVFEPTQEQIVQRRQLLVKGETDPGVSIVVNNQPVLVSDDGTFETTLEIFEGTNDVQITATSRSGKVTTINRTIRPNLN